MKKVIGISVGIAIFSLIIIPILLVTVILDYSSGDEDTDTTTTTTASTTDDVTLTISGYAFPIVGCNYENNISELSKSTYPSYSGHTGLDIGVGVSGKTVVAYTDGIVVTSTAKIDSDGNYTSYGEYVIIAHTDDDGNVYYTLYAHMVAGSRLVSKGDTVVQGQALGTVGATGNVTGVHLHFEVRIGSNSSTATVDPRPYLQ